MGTAEVTAAAIAAATLPAARTAEGLATSIPTLTQHPAALGRRRTPQARATRANRRRRPSRRARSRARSRPRRRLFARRSRKDPAQRSGQAGFHGSSRSDASGLKRLEVISKPIQGRGRFAREPIKPRLFDARTRLGGGFEMSSRVIRRVCLGSADGVCDRDRRRPNIGLKYGRSAGPNFGVKVISARATVVGVSLSDGHGARSTTPSYVPPTPA